MYTARVYTTRNHTRMKKICLSKPPALRDALMRG